ncbi:NUDIX hydrolase family protein [Georgenia sp. TF02-10]|uniref:NUDIX hydrolase family protein n=1 Tax=Georgenia sp. TF02-10 TaxID=2917725 RepID=UPI001FA7F31A|nr:NUDIX hydrolase family protein [Georgenia sp. TF02-10]UNX56441.1 NUDIX hydrolase family protein [Georgenia sp. TF02-10]
MGPWLSPEDLESVRRKVPMLYIDALPVRVDDAGEVEAVGLLLRVTEAGTMSRALVSGRVLFHETVRQALARHLEKDLGPMALPRLPLSPVPYAVGEYFPTPGSPFYDPRQHAVSLAYVVPVVGDCRPSHDTLELTWLTPAEALLPEILADMSEGHASLLRRAMAHLGRLY